MKKILALVLTLAMMLTMFNVGLVVSADHLTEVPDETWTAINDEAGFLAMEANGQYILMADITLDADRVGGAGTEDTYTIPAGVTLDGNGYAILSGRYNPAGTATEENWTTSADTTKSIEWASALLVLGSGAKITISNVKFGTEANPLFLSKTSSNAALFTNDDAATEVEWNDVDFYLARYGAGLGSVNLGTIMATAAGTHTFNNCTRDGLASAGYQAGGWIYTASGNITMNKCVNNGNLAGSYKGGFIHTASGTVTMNNCVNNVSLSLSNSDGASALGGFMCNGTGTITLNGCVNNGTIGTKGAKIGGFIGNLSTNKRVELKNCVNNGAVSSSLGGSYVGGLIGQAWVSSGWNAKIENCKNYGAITGASMAGGIAGEFTASANGTGTIEFVDCVNKGIITGANIGGILGRTVNDRELTLSFTRCINTGVLTGTHTIGGMTSAITEDTTINGCVNTADIDISANGERAGGMVGKLQGAGDKLTILNSINTGIVKGSAKPTDADYGYYMGSVGQMIGAINDKAGTTSDAWGDIYVCNVYAAGSVVLHADAMTPDGSAALTTPYNNGIAGWNVNFTANSMNMIVLGNSDEQLENGKYIIMSQKSYIIDSANQNSNLPVDFMMDNGEIIIASPALAGYQISTDGTAVRFLATIDTLAYDNIGFTYTVEIAGDTVRDNVTKTSTYVYEAINANVNGIVSEKTAASMGAAYIYAITFTNAPTTGTVVYTLKAIANSGSYAAQTYTITFTDGAFVSCVLAA